MTAPFISQTVQSIKCETKLGVPTYINVEFAFITGVSSDTQVDMRRFHNGSFEARTSVPYVEVGGAQPTTDGVIFAQETA
jgi:hypothetical protein